MKSNEVQINENTENLRIKTFENLTINRIKGFSLWECAEHIKISRALST